MKSNDTMTPTLHSILVQLTGLTGQLSGLTSQVLALMAAHEHPVEPEIDPEPPEPGACDHHEDHHGDIPEGHKRCSKCGEVLPIEQFSKNRTRKDGLHGWCRRCNAEHHADYHAANLALNRKLEATGSNPRIPVSKTCSTCGVEKAASEFSRSRNRADGLESRCRQCESERLVAYRARTRALSASLQLGLHLPTPSAPDLDPRDRLGRATGFRALAGRSLIKLG